METTRRDLRAMSDDVDALGAILESLTDAHERANEARLTRWAAKVAALRAEVEQARDALDDHLGQEAHGYVYRTGRCDW